MRAAILVLGVCVALVAATEEHYDPVEASKQGRGLLLSEVIHPILDKKVQSIKGLHHGAYAGGYHGGIPSYGPSYGYPQPYAYGAPGYGHQQPHAYGHHGSHHGGHHAAQHGGYHHG